MLSISAFSNFMRKFYATTLSTWDLKKEFWIQKNSEKESLDCEGVYFKQEVKNADTNSSVFHRKQHLSTYRHNVFFSFTLAPYKLRMIFFCMSRPMWIAWWIFVCLEQSNRFAGWKKNYFRMMHIKKIGLIGGFEYTFLL